MLRYRVDPRSLIFGVQQCHLVRRDGKRAAVIGDRGTEFVRALRSLNPLSATY